MDGYPIRVGFNQVLRYTKFFLQIFEKFYYSEWLSCEIEITAKIGIFLFFIIFLNLIVYELNADIYIYILTLYIIFYIIYNRRKA